MLSITYDGRQSIADIQSRFRTHLSEKEILKSTAYTLNEVGKKVQAFIKKEVKRDYTMSKKYLDRTSAITHKAKSEASSLYVDIEFNYRTVPMVAFKHTGSPGSKRPIKVTIKKGTSTTFKHAFIATMNSGHKGIFSSGRYINRKFVHDKSKTNSGKTRITELRSASPFTMSTSKAIEPRITKYVGGMMIARLKHNLQRKVNKMKTL